MPTNPRSIAAGHHESDWTVRDPEQRVFDSQVVWIGSFRCPAGHPRWRSENNAGERSLIVFPRTMVGIQQAGRQPVLCDSTRIMLYNAWQPYTRQLVDPRGDACEWFGVDAETLRDALCGIDPAAADRDQPFLTASILGGAHTYLAQRRLFELVRRRPDADRLHVEERFCGLMRDVARAISEPTDARRVRRPRRSDTAACHRDMVECARVILGREFTTRHALRDLARRVNTSPYHLCRLFRLHTGLTIHAFLTQLRLREALEHLREPGADLTNLALELGFSSHAHFSDAFRKTFGMPPSVARASLSAADIRQMSKDLKAAKARRM